MSLVTLDYINVEEITNAITAIQDNEAQHEAQHEHDEKLGAFDETQHLLNLINDYVSTSPVTPKEYPKSCCPVFDDDNDLFGKIEPDYFEADDALFEVDGGIDEADDALFEHDNGEDDYIQQLQPEPVDDTGVQFVDNLRQNKARIKNNIDPSYFDRKLLCLFRVYVYDKKEYKYHLVFTKDLSRTIEDIDNEYVSEWKIEVVALQDAKSQDDEVTMRYALFKRNQHLDDNCYNISYEIVDKMSLLSSYVNPFYAIDVKNNESYMGHPITSKQDIPRFDDYTTAGSIDAVDEIPDIEDEIDLP